MYSVCQFDDFDCRHDVRLTHNVGLTQGFNQLGISNWLLFKLMEPGFKNRWMKDGMGISSPLYSTNFLVQ